MPKSLDNRKQQDDTPLVSPRRRSLLGKIWWGLGGLAIAEYCWLVAEFLKPRKSNARDSGTGQTIVAGPVDNFAPDSVTAFPDGKFYLVRLTDGGFLALHRECTHLGCTVPWIAQDRRFVCPCHSSSFTITGEVLGAPAPRPLDLLVVRIENGFVKVDTGKRIRRRSFESGQVTRIRA